MPPPKDPARYEAWRLALRRARQARHLATPALPPLADDTPPVRLMRQPPTIDHEALASRIRSLEASAALLMGQADGHPRFSAVAVGLHVRRELAGVLAAVELAQRNLDEAAGLLKATREGP